MKEVQGKFNMAKIFADTIEDASLEQIKVLCNSEFAEGCQIRIMPDVHAGKGCTIGTTMTVKDKIVPNLVGVDIGCGMDTYVLQEKNIDLKKLDDFIHKNIPAGMSARETPHELAKEVDLSQLRCRKKVNIDYALRSLGTLGGGNHFIEVDKDDEGNNYLVVHSGSRNLGIQVAEYYQNIAYDELNQRTDRYLRETTDMLREQKRYDEIKSTITRMKNQIISDKPKELAYLQNALFDDYIHDMKIVQQYAIYNREAMAGDIIKGMDFHVKEHFLTIHNYIDTENMILRKGSVSARAGEKLLIPINMRDGSLICIGKGNPDWNYSAPHGAGRLFSRNEVKRRFGVEAYKEAMKGIYSTTVNDETLDECPMAYKNMEEIVRNIEPTAQIVKIIKPIYNFKAAENKRDMWRSGVKKAEQNTI